MADYKVTDTELTSIANAIRAKTGKSAQIEFPAEFVSEIGSISGGGDDPYASLTNYLQSNGTQYFITDYLVKNNTRVEALASVDTKNQFPAIFGVREKSDTKAFVIYCRWNSANAMRSLVGSAFPTERLSASYSAPFYNNKVLFVLGINGIKLERPNNYPCTGIGFTGGEVTQEGGLGILVQNSVDGTDFGITALSGKLYRVRIFEGDNLVRDYIPALDGNNVACLYDNVNDQYIYNAGTGIFVYGTDT